MRLTTIASCFVAVAFLALGTFAVSSARASPLELYPSVERVALALHIADLKADLDRLAVVREFLTDRHGDVRPAFDRHDDIRMATSTTSLPFSPAARREVALVRTSARLQVG
jgi:hypothetical protein